MSEKDPAYDGRYLFHEWFHAVEHHLNLIKNDATHAALELSDNYLNCKVLDGRKNMGYGHEFLTKYRERISPYFRDFLNDMDSKNFIEFRAEIAKKFPTQEKDDLTI